MAEKLKDAEDRLLESMFRAEAIADDGFSYRVVARIRRRLWVQRLTMPIAIIIGGAIAIRPATQLLLALPKFLAVVPQVQMGTVGVPLSQVIVLGAMLLGAAVLGIRLLED